jgi:hypothetical protein
VHRDDRSGRKRILSAIAARPTHRPLRRAAITVAVVLGLLFAVDRVGVVVAQSLAAHAVQRHFALDQKPSVQIHGFPFLTQAIAGKYDDVTVALSGLSVGESGRKVRINKLTARLRDVHTSADFRSAHADTATGSVLLLYPDLSTAIGVQIGYGGAGRIKSTRTVTVLGQSVTGTVTAGVAVSGPTALSFSNPQVDVAGAAVPDAVTSALSGTFGAPLVLTGMPVGLRLGTVRVTEAGVLVTAVGQNVYIRES